MKYFLVLLFLETSFKYGSLTGCNNNEVESNCVNMVCQYKDCSQIDQPIECVHSWSGACKNGCICKDKYLRDDNGICIPISECPNFGKCKKENEYYDLCPSTCPRICGVNDTSSNCTESLNVGDPRCLPPTCMCKVGFYRNVEGVCVVSSLCDTNSTSLLSSTQTTPSPSSETNTAVGNGTNSTSVSSLFQTTPSPSSETNTAVGNETSSSGGSVNKCGKNEVYEKKPCLLCRPFKCSELGFPLACSQNGYSKNCTLKPGCICANGYVRNEDNVCVPKKKCPSCGGDPNAEIGCGLLCKKCGKFLNVVIMVCPKFCDPNGCGCKSGYVYNTKNKCVLPQECHSFFGKSLENS